MKRFSMFILLAAIVGGLAVLGNAMAADAPDGPPLPRQDAGRGVVPAARVDRAVLLPRAFMSFLRLSWGN